MKVNLSSVGRFHHFDLAKTLAGCRCLEVFYTGYPRSRVSGVPPKRIKSFPYVVAPMMLAGRYGLSGIARALNWTAAETFDRWVASQLRPCDVLVANESNGRHSYQRARKLGAKLVCNCGQGHVEFVRETLQEEYRRWDAHFPDYDRRSLEKRLQEYGEADLITVLSNFAQNTFLDRGVPQLKLAVVRPAADLSRFHSSPKRDRIFRVLFVGTLGIRKGLGYLLEALSDLRLSDFELLLIGGLSAEAKSLLARFRDRVPFRVIGFVPRTQLYRYYSQGSVLVLPSLVEGLAGVMAQAMACGLPVIATPNAGAADLYAHGVEGCIVPTRDVAAIREKVLLLYENPHRQALMTAAALRLASRLRQPAAFSNQVVETYRSLVSPGKVAQQPFARRC